MKHFITRFTLLPVLICFFISVKSQVLFSEGFEGSFPPSNWALTNVGGTGWGQNVVFAVSGTKSMKCNGNINSASNAWAFTPAVALTANNKYRVSYWYRTASNPEYMKVTIGTGQTISSQTTIVHNYPGIITTTFKEGIDTISASSTGNYYFAFNYYSGLGASVVSIDSIVISRLIPVTCTSVPFIGMAIAPGIVSNNSSFTLSLSGDYSLYLGLQFQWQSSSPGANSFQDIPGATTQNYQTTQNSGKDYRCKISCATNSSTAYSNIVKVSLPQEGALFREQYIGDTALTSHIYGIHFLNASTGFAAFRDSVGFTQDSGHTYIKKGINIGNTNFNGFSNVNLTFGFSISGVYAFSIDSLLLYGDYGAGPAILFSFNQGLTWKLVFHQEFALNPTINNSIFDIKFLNNTNGVAINQKNIIETIDRGQTWAIKKQIPANRGSNFAKLSVPNASIAYAVAGDYVYQRLGGSWSELSNQLPDNPGLNYNNISFTSSARGYIVRSDNGSVYMTVNSGSTWTKMNDQTFSPAYASDVYFANDSTGFIASSQLYNVLKTTDYGKTWEFCKRNSNYQFALYGMDRLFFLNGQTGWAGGRGEYLMMTTTGGSPTIPKALFKTDTTNLSSTGNVNLLSGSKTYYQHSWYKNGILISSSINTSYIHDIYTLRDTIKLIVSNGTDSDSLIVYQDFPPYIQVPVISSFIPSTAYENTSITVSGSGFNGATNVSFGGIEALSFIVHSNYSITALVAGGSSGFVAVTTSHGTGVLNGFTFNLLPAPVITSVSPTSGPIGTIVTINGNGFNSNAAANIILFGKMKAKILSANLNQITCEVPLGASYDPIVVINLSNHLSATSKVPFNITFTGNGNVTVNSFYKVLDILTGTSNGQNMAPAYLTAGDFDGDGKNDIALAALYNGFDSIFLYKNFSLPGNISFGPRIKIGLADNAANCTISDLDNDGKLDLSFIGPDQYLNILRNTSTIGNISFDTPLRSETLVESEQLCVSDLNGDGKPELIAAIYGPSRLTILKNVSVGSTIRFAPKIQFVAPGNIKSVAVGDIDGDGKPDVVAGGNATTFSLYRNTSGPEDISFSPRIDLTGVGNVSKVFVSDIDNDGKPDILITYVTNFTAYSVFKNTSTLGNISFAARLDFTSAGSEIGSSGEINNFSGDSLPDIFTGNRNFYNIHFRKNISAPVSINFEPEILYGSNRAWTLCSSDFDNDGKPDIAVPDNAYFKLSFYRNRVNEPVSVAFCPASGAYMYLSSNVNGSTYQWQKYDGTMYVNLTDNATYVGTGTAVLKINAPQTSWYGFKYRCLVNSNNYSDEFSLKFEATWTGFANTAWENSSNWECYTVPDAYTDVIIPSGTVKVNSNVSIRSMNLGWNVNFTINPAYNFLILH